MLISTIRNCFCYNSLFRTGSGIYMYQSDSEPIFEGDTDLVVLSGLKTIVFDITPKGYLYSELKSL